MFVFILDFLFCVLSVCVFSLSLLLIIFFSVEKWFSALVANKGVYINWLRIDGYWLLSSY